MDCYYPGKIHTARKGHQPGGFFIFGEKLNQKERKDLLVKAIHHYLAVTPDSSLRHDLGILCHLQAKKQKPTYREIVWPLRQYWSDND